MVNNKEFLDGEGMIYVAENVDSKDKRKGRKTS